MGRRKRETTIALVGLFRVRLKMGTLPDPHSGGGLMLESCFSSLVTVFYSKFLRFRTYKWST